MDGANLKMPPSIVLETNKVRPISRNGELYAEPSNSIATIYQSKKERKKRVDSNKLYGKMVTQPQLITDPLAKPNFISL